MNFSNFSRGTLTAELAAGGTFLNITLTPTGGAFPTAGRFKAIIWGSAQRQPLDDANREIMTLTWNAAQSRFDIISRGEEGTTARLWAAGSNISHDVTASQFAGFQITGENAQTGTVYTLVLEDAARLVSMNNASANTLTVPTNATAAIPIGTKIMITQLGLGATTIAAAGGVTINNPTSVALNINEQFGSRVLVKRGTNTWLLI